MFKKILLLSALLSTTSAFSTEMKFVCSAFLKAGTGEYISLVATANTRDTAYKKLLALVKTHENKATFFTPVVQVGDNYLLATVVNACAENL